MLTNAPLCVVMVDFDGLLCDMKPFTGELQTDGRDRWSRFFAHTPHAEPVVAGVELLARVDALGWRYAVSTTRPAMPGVRELITNWLAAHLSSLQPPAAVSLRKKAELSAADHKFKHCMTCGSNKPLVALFVDDEDAVIDELVNRGAPAVSLGEVAGLNDAELADLLEYSRNARLTQWQERRNRVKAKKQQHYRQMAREAREKKHV